MLCLLFPRPRYEIVPLNRSPGCAGLFWDTVVVATQKTATQASVLTTG